MYYCYPINPGKQILSANIGDWSMIRASDNINVFVDRTRIGIISNVNSFLSNAYIKVRYTFYK